MKSEWMGIAQRLLLWHRCLRLSALQIILSLDCCLSSALPLRRGAGADPTRSLGVLQMTFLPHAHS